MPRDLKMSRPLIASMISFVNINNLFTKEIIYIVMFMVAYWDNLDDNVVF